jgi:hypothetical protein
MDKFNDIYYKFCLIGNSHTLQFDEIILMDNIEAYGASIFGLFNENSVLKLKDSILNYQNNNPNKTLVFFLGQTDIEFIYYFKSVKKNVKLDIHAYIDDLIEKYIYFVKTNITNNCVILGINPHVIKDNIHIFNVNFRGNPTNIDPNGSYNEKYIFEDYLHIYNDSYEDRFKYNIEFNEKLKLKCEENNINFCCINKYILDENNNVKSEFCLPYLDHHLKKNKILFYYLLEEIHKFIK